MIMQVNKVLQTPALPCDPDSFYFVKNGDSVECYLSDNTGNNLNRIFQSENFPTVQGPLDIGPNVPYEYTITDFDIATVYTISAANGTASRVGDVITFQASALGNASLTVNNLTIPITVSPVNQAPIFNRVFEGYILGAQGDIDLTPGYFYEYPECSAVYDDGRCVIVNEASPDSHRVISKFNSDGTRDITFGTNGNVILPAEYDDLIFIHIFTNNSNNEIGILLNKSYLSNPGLLLSIIKVNSLGIITDTVDLSQFHPNRDYAYTSSVLKQTDGKYLIGFRYYFDDLNNYTLRIFRLNNNFTIDSTFGINGICDVVRDPTFIDPVTNYNYYYYYYRYLIINSNNEIFVPTVMDILKINTNGTIDTTFGNNGYLSKNGWVPDSMKYEYIGETLIHNNKFLFAIHNKTTGNSIIKLFNMDGSLDTTFGTNGITELNIFGIDNFTPYNSLYHQSDNKIIIINDLGLGTIYGSCIIRLNADGTIDTTFGNNGYIIHADFDNEFYVWGPEYNFILPNDKIVITGNSWSWVDDTEPAFILRLNSNGSLDTSFGGNISYNPDIRLGCTPNVDVVLLPGLKVTDFELSSLNNFSGSKISIFRINNLSEPAPDARDVYSFINGFTVDNNDLIYNSETIANIVNYDGSLMITLTAANVSNSLLNNLLQSITYKNIMSDIDNIDDWDLRVIISDENTGTQGIEGPKEDSMLVRLGYVRGLLLSTSCSGVDKQGTYTDGNGGSFTITIEPNSPECLASLMLHDPLTETVLWHDPFDVVRTINNYQWNFIDNTPSGAVYYTPGTVGINMQSGDGVIKYITYDNKNISSICFGNSYIWTVGSAPPTNGFAPLVNKIGIIITLDKPGDLERFELAQYSHANEPAIYISYGDVDVNAAPGYSGLRNDTVLRSNALFTTWKLEVANGYCLYYGDNTLLAIIESPFVSGYAFDSFRFNCKEGVDLTSPVISDIKIYTW